MPLFGGLAIPGDRLRLVLLDPATLLVHHAEAGHPRQATCRRRWLALRQRFLIAFRLLQGATEIGFQIDVVGVLLDRLLAHGHSNGGIDLLERDAAPVAPPGGGELPATLDAGKSLTARLIRHCGRVCRQQQHHSRDRGEPGNGRFERHHELIQDSVTRCG